MKNGDAGCFHVRCGQNLGKKKESKHERKEGQSKKVFEGCWETICEPERAKTREKYLPNVTVRGACTGHLLQFIQLSLFNGSSHEWVEMKAEK